MLKEVVLYDTISATMRVAVVGTGYVGLVTGTCFAEMGNEVVCVDIDETKVANMQKGRVPIYEPQLEELFAKNIAAGRLRFTTSLAEGVKGAQVIFLALPTPPGGDGAADLSFVLDVSDKLGPLLADYTVLVDKSTVPVGTAARVAERIGKRAKVDFDVVSNPEFLREGFAVSDFMKPDRIVVGTQSRRARAVMEALYEPFTRVGSQLIFMDERSAEMTKYAANSFLATKISFMNEIANLCERLGADADAVREGIGTDERIGKRFLYPGIGYGGSCFPKDVQALNHTAQSNGYDFKILEAVMAVNERQKQQLVNKVVEYYDGKIEGKNFALWGLAFKPDTDDIREAPALEVIKNLTEMGASIRAYDPEAMDNVKRLHADNKKLTFGADLYDVLNGADALLIATEWEVFRAPDFSKIKKLLKKPVIFDGRNLYSLKEVRQAGFYYNSIGRKVIERA
jgi:UDPglucose 6-dehydrogenase